MPPSRQWRTRVSREGLPSPNFTLTSDTGEAVDAVLAERSRRSSSTFIPKTTRPAAGQACGIRDAWGAFGETGAVVLGVSPDDEASHEKFKLKYDLPFTLLADTDHEVADAYGVWGEKSYAARRTWASSARRLSSTPEGNPARAFHDVKPAEHADQGCRERSPELATTPRLD